MYNIVKEISYKVGNRKFYEYQSALNYQKKLNTTEMYLKNNLSPIKIREWDIKFKVENQKYVLTSENLYIFNHNEKGYYDLSFVEHFGGLLVKYKQGKTNKDYKDEVIKVLLSNGYIVKYFYLQKNKEKQTYGD